MSDILDKSQFEKFADELANQYPSLALVSATKAMTDAADYLLSQIPEYPQETLGRIMPPDGVTWLKTPQQRAWFFAAVQANELPGWKWVEAEYDIENGKKFLRKHAHPEKVGGARKGNLGRAQTRQVTMEENSVIGKVGFDPAIAPYAPWVVGPSYPGEEIGGETMYQAQIHADRWWQFGSIIGGEIDNGWKVFEETFWSEFSKRINA